MQGPESGTTEVVCQSDNNTPFTSGGGFSTFYDQSLYQKSSVAAYFSAAASGGQSPSAGCNKGGSGYPDVTLAGCKYIVRVGGRYYSTSGTSASTPSVAGFISNISAVCIPAGKGSVGWVNPVLFAYSTSFVKDI